MITDSCNQTSCITVPIPIATLFILKYTCRHSFLLIIRISQERHGLVSQKPCYFEVLSAAEPRGKSPPSIPVVTPFCLFSSFSSVV